MLLCHRWQWLNQCSEHSQHLPGPGSPLSSQACTTRWMECASGTALSKALSAQTLCWFSDNTLKIICYKRFLFKRVHTRQIDKLELLSWQFAAAAKEFCWTLVENNRILLFCMKNTVKQTAKAATIVVAKYSKVWEEAAQDTSAPCQRCRTKGSPDRTPC